MNKIKSFFNMAIIVVFIISIIYFIFFGITNYLNKDKDIIKINNENLNEYIKDEKLVTDYTMYYTLEKIVQDCITLLHDEKYMVFKNISFSKLKLNKEILEKYYTTNFKYDIVDGLDIEGYFNNNNLNRVYQVSKNSYICDVKTLKNNTKIGIKLIDNKNYQIFYIEL